VLVVVLVVLVEVVWGKVSVDSVLCMILCLCFDVVPTLCCTLVCKNMLIEIRDADIFWSQSMPSLRLNFTVHFLSLYPLGGHNTSTSSLNSNDATEEYPVNLRTTQVSVHVYAQTVLCECVHVLF